MIVKTFLAASLALAFASATAFAQGAAPAAPAPAAEPAAADAPAMASDAKPMKAMHHHKHHAMHHGHGHVAGDPAVIDRSGDHLVVEPTTSKITVPAGGH